ncbi:MAG: adenylate/guanylate cyclase domain-containing protein, partial [Spirochaetia bacterium]
MTVLFADMKDFTSLSERMDPEEMDSLMNQVFTTFEAIVRRHGGTVEKYIGDALVAVFGVPSIHEDDPARAVNAALDILDEISRINASISENSASIGFRIGINTGLITTGRRGEHDVVTGHAMSVASRLESEARVNSVLVSETTLKHCDAEFVFSEPVALKVKGKSDEIIAFEVTGRNERPVDDDSVFVGRKEILDTILRRFLRHEPGETDGFVLSGEAGMGKSRLAAQLVGKFRQLPDFRSPVLYARAMRYRPQPFAVVLDLLSSYFGLDGLKDRSEIEAAVRERSSVEARTVAGFADLVTGESKSHDNEAFVLLYLVVKDVVKRYASEPYPPLLLVDNLRFMDRHSRDFFRFFLKNADIKPFFILTDRHPDPGIQEVFEALETVQLHPLSREEAIELIQETCPPSGRPDGCRAGMNNEMLNSILDNSQGNPLFIREYIRFVAENRDAGTLPTTIQNIFLTSIDPYDPPMRDLLKKLSVFAHSFSVADASHIHERTDGDSRMVEPALSFFARESILVREDDLYMFKHDVFKKALYNSILNYNKRILHRVIGELMVQKGNPHPLRLLLHLIRAEEYDKAASSLWEISGLTGNLEYLPSIDVLLDKVRDDDADTYFRLLFVKSAILFNHGMSDEADLLLNDIIDLAVRRHSPMYAGSAYHLLTAYNMNAYCFEKARYCGTNALAYYRSADTPVHRVQNLMEIMASSEMLRNDREEVDRLLQEIEESETFGSLPESTVQLSVSKAEHLLMRGEYQEARKLLTPQITDLPRESDNWLNAHLMLGIANFHRCDWRELIRVGHAILEDPSRHYANISRINAQIAIGHHFLGDDKSAAQRLQQAEFTGSQVKNVFGVLDAYRTLSECYLIMGNQEKAEEFAEIGVGIGLRHSATYPVLTLLMVLAEIAMDEERSDEDRPDRAKFLVSEAGLLIDRGVLLRNRDVALYHYFRSRLAEDPVETEAAANAARLTLRREMACIGNDELVAAFMHVRSFGKISKDLLVDPRNLENEVLAEVDTADLPPFSCLSRESG